MFSSTGTGKLDSLSTLSVASAPINITTYTGNYKVSDALKNALLNRTRNPEKSTFDDATLLQSNDGQNTSAIMTGVVEEICSSLAQDESKAVAM